ncbi:MAG: ATP-binding cassette domain-containing protein [Nitriliruptorales bacterium]|nr:ATP-binding cassette domain-containing protein [Nitriliruptorales bacterium]
MPRQLCHGGLNHLREDPPLSRVRPGRSQRGSEAHVQDAAPGAQQCGPLAAGPDDVRPDQPDRNDRHLCGRGQPCEAAAEAEELAGRRPCSFGKDADRRPLRQELGDLLQGVEIRAAAFDRDHPEREIHPPTDAAGQLGLAEELQRAWRPGPEQEVVEERQVVRRDQQAAGPGHLGGSTHLGAKPADDRWPEPAVAEGGRRRHACDPTQWGASHGLPIGRRGAVPAAIEVDRLTKHYGDRPVVDGVSFTVEAGEVLALLGPNGAGKTTTVECAVGLRHADGGRVRVLGADPVRERGDIAERLGVMLQEGGAYQAATPREMIALYAAFYPRSLSMRDTLALVDLEARADARFRTLSGGEKQRVNLALALVGRPSVVFLDEPTAGMDPAARGRTWGVIEHLRAENVAVLFTTHYLEEAERLADKVAIMARGRLRACDTPQRLVAGEPTIVVITRGRVPVADLAAAIGAPATRSGTNRYVIQAPPDRVAAVVAWFADHDLPIDGITTRPTTLEDVFLTLTGSDR